MDKYTEVLLVLVVMVGDMVEDMVINPVDGKWHFINIFIYINNKLTLSKSYFCLLLKMIHIV
jgi:hypothetical protein